MPGVKSKISSGTFAITLLLTSTEAERKIAEIDMMQVLCFFAKREQLGEFHTLVKEIR